MRRPEIQNKIQPLLELIFFLSNLNRYTLRAKMKLLDLLTLTVLPLLCFAAKRPSGGTFENYHAKSQSSAPLRIDDASYDELTATPRNHSVVVLLTALEARFGCQLCRDFQPEWDLLGKSWAKGDKHGDSRILLGTLDFADGKGTFQKVFFYDSSVDTSSGWIRLTASYSPAHATDSSDLSFVSTNNRSERKARWAAHSL